VLCLAVFDAVLVHVLHAVAPDSWQARAEGSEREGMGARGEGTGMGGDEGRYGERGSTWKEQGG
jgi:hypothetical protein